jgi:hypothetical protein
MLIFWQLLARKLIWLLFQKLWQFFLSQMVAQIEIVLANVNKPLTIIEQF